MGVLGATCVLCTAYSSSLVQRGSPAGRVLEQAISRSGVCTCAVQRTLIVFGTAEFYNSPEEESTVMALLCCASRNGRDIFCTAESR